jgi:hypothetical protein
MHRYAAGQFGATLPTSKTRGAQPQSSADMLDQTHPINSRVKATADDVRVVILNKLVPRAVKVVYQTGSRSVRRTF